MNPETLSSTAATSLPPSTAIVPTASSPASLIAINFAAQIPLKLTQLNFASWRAQLTSVLIGYDLMKFLDGTHPCPPSAVAVNGIVQPNPEYTFWIRQDQLLLNALLASVTETVIPFVASFTTSQQAWQTPVSMYASTSHSRIMNLRNSFANLRKDSLSVTDYLQKLKLIADTLAAAHNPVSADELIIYALNDAGSKYRDFAAAIRARNTPITFEELLAKMVEHETTLQTDDLLQAPPLSVAHNVVKTASHSQHSKRGGRSHGHPKRSSAPLARP